jgi:hypothetical protein
LIPLPKSLPFAALLVLVAAVPLADTYPRLFVASPVKSVVAGVPAGQPTNSRLAEMTGMSRADGGATLSDFEEDFRGPIRGHGVGLTLVTTPFGKGAAFSAAKESRIVYSRGQGFPGAGTYEWIVKIDSGYHYREGRYSSNDSRALLFTTDCAAGDVTWPGSAWLWLHDDGTIRALVATQQGQRQPGEVLTAAGTEFRFGQWHAVGWTVGDQGMALTVDGRIVARDRRFVQPLAGGGTHSEAVDQPTIGESVSGFWRNNRYDAGFEGILARFRVSSRQHDWKLTRTAPAPTGVSPSPDFERP